jgi:recombinational DNA repair protein RecR
MPFSPMLIQLIDALRCMPGIGKKSRYWSLQSMPDAQ